MRRECEENCPKIRYALDQINYSQGDQASNERDLKRVLAQEDNCKGPRTTVIDVRKGIINRRVVREELTLCGLDNASPFQHSGEIYRPVRVVGQKLAARTQNA